MTKNIVYFFFSFFILLGFATQAQSDMAKEFVKAHNHIRAEVGLPPLQWSNEIANYAQEWANQLKNDNCAFKHRPNGKYGENLAMQWGGEMPSPSDFVAQWYEEKSAFDKHFLDMNGNVVETCCNGFMEYGHYSQIVWEKTSEVGCAVVKCGNKYICVCNYNPAGNMRGSKPFTKIKKSPSVSHSSSKSGSSTNTSSAGIAELANKFCDCINQVMDSYDPRVVTYLQELARYGENIATQNFSNLMAKLSETEQESLIKDLDRLEDMPQEMLNIPVCMEIEELEAQYASDDRLEEKTMSYLENKSNCQIAYIFMMLGLQEEDDN